MKITVRRWGRVVNTLTLHNVDGPDVSVDAVEGLATLEAPPPKRLTDAERLAEIRAAVKQVEDREEPPPPDWPVARRRGRPMRYEELQGIRATAFQYIQAIMRAP